MYYFVNQILPIWAVWTLSSWYLVRWHPPTVFEHFLFFEKMEFLVSSCICSAPAWSFLQGTQFLILMKSSLQNFILCCVWEIFTQYRYFSPYSFTVLIFIFRSMTHFELIFYVVWGMDSSLFYIQIFNFPILLLDSLLHCLCEMISYPCSLGGLFLGSLVVFLFVCFLNTTLSLYINVKRSYARKTTGKMFCREFLCLTVELNLMMGIMGDRVVCTCYMLWQCRYNTIIQELKEYSSNESFLRKLWKNKFQTTKKKCFNRIIDCLIEIYLGIKEYFTL